MISNSRRESRFCQNQGALEAMHEHDFGAAEIDGGAAKLMSRDFSYLLHRDGIQHDRAPQ